MDNPRLLTDAELVKYMPKIVAVDAVTFAVQIANMAVLIRDAQDAKSYEAGKAAKTPTVEDVAKTIHKGLDDAFGKHETGWSCELWETMPEDWRIRYKLVATAIIELFKSEGIRM
jgi:hypothetical protein